VRAPRGGESAWFASPMCSKRARCVAGKEKKSVRWERGGGGVTQYGRDTKKTLNEQIVERETARERGRGGARGGGTHTHTHTHIHTHTQPDNLADWQTNGRVKGRAGFIKRESWRDCPCMSDYPVLTKRMGMFARCSRRQGPRARRGGCGE